MDEEYDPLSHLSTALSLLPCTLAEIGFSLPIALSAEDQMSVFFDYVHQMLEMEPQPSIPIHASKLSPNPDSMVLEKDKIGKLNSEGRNDLDFRLVESMLESPPSISSDSHNPCPAPEKTKVEDRRARRRPGLGLVYNISPFKLIQKNEKAKQVVPVDFTVLDRISDPDTFIKKAYELEAAVAEIQRLGGEANIIGERVFKAVEDDQPRRRRPGLGLQMERPKFVPLPMRPLPVKVQPACTCQNRAPAQSTSPPETTKVTAFSGSQIEASSSISNATNEVPEMNLYASSSFEKLFSHLESFPDDEAKATAMVLDCLDLKQHVIPPLVIPEIPNFSRLDVVRFPLTQLPSIERLRDLRGEDPLVAFQELKRKIFGSPAAYYSDDDTNPLPGVGSVRSLSTSPGYQFSFENEEMDTPSHAGPSGSPNVEIEEFPSQEKVPEMTSEARGGNFSDDDDAGDDIPDEPEMHSPRDNSPVNIEVSPSAILVEEEVVIKEAASRKGKKRELKHADAALLKRQKKEREERQMPPIIKAVCSCTGAYVDCLELRDGWQSLCCSADVSQHPLPLKGTKPILGRKMKKRPFKKIVKELQLDGYNLEKGVDLHGKWAKHGTNQYKSRY